MTPTAPAVVPGYPVVADAGHPTAGHPTAGHPAHAYRDARVEINWDYLMERRPVTLAHAPALPKYLLLPEIEQLLAATLHANHHLMLDLLWHTGARVSELLAVTPAHLFLNTEWDSFISLETLKQRKIGRPKKQGPARAIKRLVPLTDPVLMDKLQRYLATHAPGAHDRLFPVTPQAVDYRIKKACRGIDLPFMPTPHSFRHSFAVNQVLHWVPTPVLQGWLGHKNIASTEIYTAILGSETNHFMRHVQYRRAPVPALTPGSAHDAEK